jgi:UPF0716 protein FxsA
VGSLIFPVLLLPFVDLWLLARLALRVGVLPVVAAALLSAVVGMAVARSAGQRALRTLGGTLERGELPEQAVLAGAFTMIAGILLILPGFLSDVLALLLFVPRVRDALAERMSVSVGLPGSGGHVSGHTAPRGAARRGPARTEVGRIHVRDVVDTTGEEVK